MCHNLTQADEHKQFILLFFSHTIERKGLTCHKSKIIQCTFLCVLNLICQAHILIEFNTWFLHADKPRQTLITLCTYPVIFMFNFLVGQTKGTLLYTLSIL